MYEPKFLGQFYQFDERPEEDQGYDIEGMTPTYEKYYNQIWFTNKIKFPEKTDDVIAKTKFQAVFTGSIRAEEAGEYRFKLRSNDGARMTVDGNLVVDQWSPHHDAEVAEGTVQLDAGFHDIMIEYVAAVGSNGNSIKAWWAQPGDGYSRLEGYHRIEDGLMQNLDEKFLYGY